MGNSWRVNCRFTRLVEKCCRYLFTKRKFWCRRGVDAVRNYALIPVPASIELAALVTTTPYVQNAFNSSKKSIVNNLIYMKIIFKLLIVCIISTNLHTAKADISQSQESANELCNKISGVYQFLGETNSHRMQSLLNALFGTISNYSGQETAAELNYDAVRSMLRIRILRGTLEPFSDFSLKAKCNAGELSSEDSNNGYADGSYYKMNSVFQFSKDNENSLVVHKIYVVKSTLLVLFWKERTGEETTRFRPLTP